MKEYMLGLLQIMHLAVLEVILGKQLGLLSLGGLLLRFIFLFLKNFIFPIRKIDKVFIFYPTLLGHFYLLC